MNYPIEIKRGQKRFDRVEAVHDLNLKVAEGTFMGFFGPNGAGKSTTIKLMLNLISPGLGILNILGVRANRLGPKEFRRIGYVSEDLEQPLWMTLKQLIRYCEPMYPNWNPKLCDQLIDQFELPLNKKLSAMSRGMRMKAALLTSLAYQPELVILDEPFSGLDPLSRDQFIDGLLELSGRKPFTLFVSSHDISEVERLCDAVTYIERGRLRLSETTDTLLSRFRRSEVILPTPSDLRNLPHRLGSVETTGNRMRFVDSQYQNDEEQRQFVENILPGASVTHCSPMTLREIVVHFSRQKGADL